MGNRFTSALLTCEAHHLIKSPFESKSVFTDYLTKVVLKLNHNKKRLLLSFKIYVIKHEHFVENS